MGSTISSISAAITALLPNTEPPGPRPFRPGPRSPAWPLGHRRSCDRPSCALSRPEPIKLTVPALDLGRVDIEPAGDHDVALAPHDLDPSRAVCSPKIAGRVPALGVEDL